jgi:hypothetical protein
MKAWRDWGRMEELERLILELKAHGIEVRLKEMRGVM